MCDRCGCAVDARETHVHDARGVTVTSRASVVSVEVLTDLRRQNDLAAAHNRAHFDRHGVLAVNLMSSPGAGKTSLLEATVDALGGRYRIAVIEGDLETENDARRIRAKGVPAVQIVTGQTCHLDAPMVHDALHGIDLDAIDLLFIENVGNLVCPAGFDLGQHANIVLLSVTEGDDKPSKYPVIFRVADLVLLTKADLLPVMDDFSPDRARRNLRALGIANDSLEVSIRRPDGLQPWLEWLEREIRHRRARPGMAAAAR